MVDDRAERRRRRSLVKATPIIRRKKSRKGQRPETTHRKRKEEGDLLEGKENTHRIREEEEAVVLQEKENANRTREEEAVLLKEKVTRDRRREEEAVRLPEKETAHRNREETGDDLLQGKSSLGKYSKLFLEDGVREQGQLKVRFTCESESIEEVRKSLLRWLREEGVDTGKEESLAQVQVGVYLGISQVPSGLVCNACALRNPHKALIFRSRKRGPIIRHFRTIHNRVRKLGDLHIIDEYDPRGGRKRLYDGSEEEIKETKKKKRKERSSLQKSELRRTKEELASAQHTIKLLQQTIVSFHCESFSQNN